MSIAAASIPIPLANVEVSNSSSDALPARRFDLIVQQQSWQGQQLFVVKDPLTLKYYRFAPAEYQVFVLLDGKRTVRQMRQLMSKDMALKSVSSADLLKIVNRWQAAGLLQEPGGTATSRILESHRQRARSKTWRWLSSILYVKVHAFDPDLLLGRIYPWVGWLFRPVGVFLAVGVMIAALGLVIARFEEFTSRPELQDVHAFFNLQNIGLLWLTVGVVKILHEFGHGLACKHFGGECHAMGLLLMCFTPCMYCDVSDSWLMPNKWHRIAIAAAGIYIELLIAAIATFVWWSTAPGVIHGIAFSAMTFGSVQTILINANPLLRFDGYYAMSDYLEIPNLRQRSLAFTRYYLKKWFWGTNEAPPGSGGLGFVVYAVLASIYSMLLVVFIIWFLTHLLEPYKLAIVGWLLAGLVATNAVLLPLGRGTVRALKNPAGTRPLSWWRPLMALSLISGVAALVFWMPIPRRAYAVMTLEPARSAAVSTSVQGQIARQNVKAGQHVKQGEAILELDNPELRLQAARLDQQCERLRLQTRNAIATLDPGRAQLFQVALKELESQRAVLQRRIDDLIVRAPEDGRVVPEPERRESTSSASTTVESLGRWHRTALSPENVGARLDVGTNVCRIATAEECVAVAILSQSRVEAVRLGDQAALKLDAFPAETFLGKVEEISLQDAQQVAPQLTNLHGSELPTIAFGPNAGQLAEAHYRVRIKLSGLSRGDLAEWLSQLKTGQRGRVWIRTGSHTVAQMVWRWACQIIQW